MQALDLKTNPIEAAQVVSTLPVVDLETKLALHVKKVSDCREEEKRSSALRVRHPTRTRRRLPHARGGRRFGGG